jgi:hypothetical protein
VGDSAPTIVCRECGASLAAGHARCWLCQHKSQAGSEPNPYAAPRPVTGEDLSLQAGVSSLVLIMALVAVNVGAFLIWPGLGALVAVISLPALVRTLVASGRSRRRGSAYSPLEKVEVFIVSVCIVFAVGMASVIAFFVVCFGGGSIALVANASETVFIGVAFGGGALAASALAIYLFHLTRPSN